jgi:hypothetical protein
MNTIIKMKKHPIDDLFAKKLAEYRQEPSQKAFEKFQARLAEKQQKPKGGFYLFNRNWGYYAAAAGIIAVLSIGFLSQTNSSKDTALASVEVKKPTIDNSIIVSKSVESQEVKSAEKAFTQQVSKKNTEQLIKVLDKKVELSNEKTFAKAQPLPIEHTIIDDSPIEQTQVALNPVFETSISETPTTTEEKADGIFKNDIGGSIVVILEPEKIENEIIPTINPDSETTLAEAKRMGEEKEENAKSFLSKLYGEYKHFKYGEKVDLKKLGVKDVLARVDNNEIKEDITDVRDFVQRKVSRLQRKD